MKKSYRDTVDPGGTKDISVMVARKGLPGVTISGDSSRGLFVRVSRSTFPRKCNRNGSLDETRHSPYVQVKDNHVDAQGYEPSSFYASKRVAPSPAKTRRFPSRKNFLIKDKIGGKAMKGKRLNFKSRNERFGKSFNLHKLFESDDSFYSFKQDIPPNGDFISLIRQIIKFSRQKRNFGKSNRVYSKNKNKTVVKIEKSSNGYFRSICFRRHGIPPSIFCYSSRFYHGELWSILGKVTRFDFSFFN